jgi:DNA-binding PadR family transcriptional regulator
MHDFNNHLKNEELRFAKLYCILECSAGNLASHPRTLKQEGYVKSHSKLNGKRLKASASITEKGQKLFDEFIEQMKNVVDVLPEN